MATTRTIRDLHGNHHCLEVGKDMLLLDGQPCSFLDITHEHITACADGSQPITLATGSFWRDLAGADPSTEDAGELLAHRLAAWVSQQVLIHTFQSLQAQLCEQGSGSTLLPTYRLDPLVEKLLRKFDGTDAMTQMLADILDQSPDVVRNWATRLAQRAGEDDAPATEQERFTEPDAPLTTGPLHALPPTESLREATPVQQPAAQRSRKTQEQWFFWTPERKQVLEEAIKEVGGLEQKFSQAAIKSLAARLGYPWKSVEYKIGQWKRERPKETPTEPAQTEEDRPATASSGLHLRYAS